jgi:hypothetical protein
MRKQDLIWLVTCAGLAAVPMMIPTTEARQSPVLPAALFLYKSVVRQRWASSLLAID